SRTGRAGTVRGRVDRGISGSRLFRRITMLGILVHGDNHFIVEGPLPTRDIAFDLVRHWSLIQIGRPTPSYLKRWSIVSKAFREDLEWAVIVPGDAGMSAAVTELLSELRARGIVAHDSRFDSW